MKADALLWGHSHKLMSTLDPQWTIRAFPCVPIDTWDEEITSQFHSSAINLKTVEGKMPSWNYSFPINVLEQVTQGLSFFTWKQTSEFLFQSFEVVDDVEKRADSRKENNICTSCAAIWEKAGARGIAVPQCKGMLRRFCLQQGKFDFSLNIQSFCSLFSFSTHPANPVKKSW